MHQWIASHPEHLPGGTGETRPCRTCPAQNPWDYLNCSAKTSTSIQRLLLECLGSEMSCLGF